MEGLTAFTKKLNSRGITSTLEPGLTLDEMEIKDFELNRESFLNNPIARDFLDAQEEMQKVQKSVSQYVSKTFELGRVPEESDMDSGSCGHGCGCHH